MKLGKKLIRIFPLSLIFIFLIFSFIFYGCNKNISSLDKEGTEEQQSSEKEETVVNETDTASGESVEDEISKMEITGNINILSGFEISDTISNSRPIAAMIENSPDSRPQSGLISADIVFEVVDEGGVTRYVAVFSSSDSEIIGPVRSARPYYAEIARSFDPIYAFWGTYPEAYKVIENLGLDALSAVADSSGNSSITAQASHWRDNSRSNITEHTGFMSTLDLKGDAERLGYSMEGGQSPLRFKIDAVESEKGNIENISVNFSYDNYKVDYKYNREDNNYLKFTAGTPHVDFETGDQISANNVIVMITDIDGPIDQYGHMVVRTTGTSDAGKAFFFLDGNIVEGSWERSSAYDPFTFKDADGNIMLFNRGKTWVSMIQSIDRLNY